jgi:hypothetical protein
MKFELQQKQPLLIDGSTKAKITIELGDIFVDKDNNYKAIADIKNGSIVFHDTMGNTSKEVINNDLFIKYRFAGTIHNEYVSKYEDSLSLCE